MVSTKNMKRATVIIKVYASCRFVLEVRTDTTFAEKILGISNLEKLHDCCYISQFYKLCCISYWAKNSR